MLNLYNTIKHEWRFRQKDKEILEQNRGRANGRGGERIGLEKGIEMHIHNLDA